MKASKGSKAKVHYTGKLNDGTVFDSSKEREPLEFVIGEGQVIPGFEKAVEGLAPGESTTTKIPADEAYGPRNEEMIVKIDRKDLPKGEKPKVGDTLTGQSPDGQTTHAKVTEISDQEITVDANHQLAGKDLTFEIELVSVE